MSAAPDAIYARLGEGLSELDGQMLFDRASPTMPSSRNFSPAEAAEDEGRFDDAAALLPALPRHRPGDAVAAFNRANCLRAAGRAGRGRA